MEFKPQIKINIPDCEKGDWKVKNFVISHDEARWHNLRELISGNGRPVIPGEYVSLQRNGSTIMSNTPAEIGDFNEFKRKATGNVLINGLGLGVTLAYILAKPDITKVTVIEIDQDLIDLISPFYTDPRVNIIHADALEYKPEKGIRFNAVWHDIWDNISIENLENMALLHRKYGRKTDWQGSWCKRLCLSMKRKEDRENKQREMMLGSLGFGYVLK